MALETLQETWPQAKQKETMFFQTQQFFRTGALIFALVVAGCSTPGEELPELVEVTGTVTLDGEPLEAAVLIFSPEAAGPKGRGRPSMGTTDAEGHYELMYNTDVTGATPGKYTVSISKSADSAPDAPEEETLPPKYNIETELTAEVTANGPNTFDFDLQESNPSN